MYNHKQSREKNFRIWSLILSLVIAIIILPAVSKAKPVSKKQAERVVLNWLAKNHEPLKMSLKPKLKDILPFINDSREILYYIIYLEPDGFVIVSGDDLVEPIIGFVSSGEYVDSLDNPLGALVKQDLPFRVIQARKYEKQRIKSNSDILEKYRAARKKWSILACDTSSGGQLYYGLPTISDIRVEPLVQTKWNQNEENGGELCYNLYTPNNYPCGCVATTMAQIMKFFEWPTGNVGTPSFNITVDGAGQTRSLLGGNGSGGAYSWSLMDNGPSVSELTHRQAIGRLTHDAGVSVNMNYAAGGSGAYMSKMVDSLKDTFNYSNAIYSGYSGDNIEAEKRNNMVNPNLDAGYPTALGISGSQGGHAIICDGYGYDTSTLYHHLNMGWGSYQDAWYNLPDIDSSPAFTSVDEVVYNIYTSGTGEIISGRVTDSSGNPINGASVTATRTGGGTYSAVTNAKGIYALVKIPSDSTYEISVSKTGYIFTSRTVSTLTSQDYSDVGNKWGIDFTDSAYKGDINQDGNVNLTDVILCLQILSGISPEEPVYTSADVNSDNRIGLEEAIYLLQKIARPDLR